MFEECCTYPLPVANLWYGGDLVHMPRQVATASPEVVPLSLHPLRSRPFLTFPAQVRKGSGRKISG